MRICDETSWQYNSGYTWCGADFENRKKTLDGIQQPSYIQSILFWCLSNLILNLIQKSQFQQQAQNVTTAPSLQRFEYLSVIIKLWVTHWHALILDKYPHKRSAELCGTVVPRATGTSHKIKIVICMPYNEHKKGRMNNVSDTNTTRPDSTPSTHLKTVHYFYAEIQSYAMTRTAHSTASQCKW